MNTHILMVKSGMTFALLTKYQSEKRSQTLFESKIRVSRRSQPPKKLAASVVELLRAKLAPCNHELNVQKRTKKNLMLSTSAFCLSFAASRRTNEHTQSNREIGHDFCPFDEIPKREMVTNLGRREILLSEVLGLRRNWPHPWSDFSGPNWHPATTI